MLAAAAVLVVGAAVAVPAFAGAHSARQIVLSKTFHLFPNKAFLSCAQAHGHTAKVTATVTRGKLNDTLQLHLSGFKHGLGFDLFTVQRSNQTATGAAVVGFTNFGLAWYQSDIETNDQGTADVRIKTILLDQIFGFDPDNALTPTNTFHVGFWFDSVAEAQPCSQTPLVATPFNGEHNAGPVAFITRPNATTGLGPLCTRPVDQGGGIFTCHP
jgi:hypothetical protein